MIFAQYYHNSTGWNGTDFSGPVKLIEKLGSDGVRRIDGRLSLGNCIREATKAANQLNQGVSAGIKGLQIMCGQSFSKARPLTKLVLLSDTN